MFRSDFYGANHFGDAVYDMFVATMSAYQLAAVVDVYVAGFTVKTKAFYFLVALKS